jgi:hypothetical protein
LRRRLLTGAIFGIGAAASTREGRAPVRPLESDASTRPHPDQHLFDACGAFEALERHARLFGSEQARSAEQAALVEVICRHQAVTVDGARRKATTVAFFAEDLLEPSHLWDRDLTASLLRDLLVADRTPALPGSWEVRS